MKTPILETRASHQLEQIPGISVQLQWPRKIQKMRKTFCRGKLPRHPDIWHVNKNQAICYIFYVPIDFDEEKLFASYSGAQRWMVSTFHSTSSTKKPKTCSVEPQNPEGSTGQRHHQAQTFQKRVLFIFFHNNVSLALNWVIQFWHFITFLQYLLLP